MKRILEVLSLAAVILSSVSCNKNNCEKETNLVRVSLKAKTCGETYGKTKVHLPSVDSQLIWDDEDRIKVYYADGYIAEAKLYEGSDEYSASFSAFVPEEKAVEIPVRAVYGNGVPAKQKFLEEGFSNGSMPLSGVFDEYSTCTFKMDAALVKIPDYAGTGEDLTLGYKVGEEAKTVTLTEMPEGKCNPCFVVDSCATDFSVGATAYTTKSGKPVQAGHRYVLKTTFYDKIALEEGEVYGEGGNQYIIWEGKSCTIKHDRNGEPTGIAPGPPSKWYKNNKISFNASEGYKIVGVEAVCTSSAYASVLATSEYSSGASANASNNTVTIVSSGNFEITMKAQTRINAITVKTIDIRED